MVSSDVWGEDEAAHYDDELAERAAPGVLGPTIDFLERRAEGGPVLEFAIGTGRVALPLAGRGVEVAGIELSEAMTAKLRAKPGAEAVPVTSGDMSTTRVAGEFALVYLVFNSISNLKRQEEQVACFANAARHLRPGGRFVLELFVPDLRRLPPGQLAVPFTVSNEYLGFDTYDPVQQLVTSNHHRAPRRHVAGGVRHVPLRVACGMRPDGADGGSRARGAIRGLRRAAVHRGESPARLRLAQAGLTDSVGVALGVSDALRQAVLASAGCRGPFQPAEVGLAC